MKVARAQIKNFRLLEDADVVLDDTATLIVGRNNSGKTSVVEIFRKLSKADSSGLNFDDISLSRHADFVAAHQAYARLVDPAIRETGEGEESLRAEVRALPAIELFLTVEYTSEDDLAPLAPFILDLDSTRFDVTIRYRAFVKNAESLFADYEAAHAKLPTTLLRYLRANYSSALATSLHAIDPQDETNEREVTEAEFQRLISVKFIYAQNPMDDLASDQTKGLSKGFESFYKSNADDSSTADHIAALLEKAGYDLDLKYADLFKSVFEDLTTFGVGTFAGLPELKVVAELEAIRVLSDNARLYFTHPSGQQLPEAHNGLGYSKLIFTILMFISFYEELKRMAPRPPLQLVFIEEPEAHLHPQMQSVFVENISNFIQSKADWNVQSIITTHSSHIVSASGFTGIRYFDNSVNPLEVRDLSKFETSQQVDKKAADALMFLKQYMVLGRCDMFFADKVVLIEGTVERLILPEIMKQVAPVLMSRYISVIEVGGAYAHLFKAILEFINVQTLVITDIDSVDPKANRTAAPVAPGMVTSNQTLATWIPKSSDIDELLAKTSADKVEARVRVAYQIPEVTGLPIGRSFEEAFVIANAALYEGEKRFKAKSGDPLTEAQILKDSADIARDLPKKTDFAFEILNLSGWSAPLYIKEGLEWLAIDL